MYLNNLLSIVQVNGVAVDWLSGSVYWTDALYDWIIVANSSATGIYNHIVLTGLDQPMGIAVYPQRGSVSVRWHIWCCAV